MKTKMLLLAMLLVPCVSQANEERCGCTNKDVCIEKVCVDAKGCPCTSKDVQDRGCSSCKTSCSSCKDISDKSKKSLAVEECVDAKGCPCTQRDITQSSEEEVDAE